MTQAWKSLFILLLVTCLHLVEGLYEDQVGKFDWRQQFIGSVQHIYRPSDKWQDHQNLIVATKSGVLAGLHLRNGKINWRHILETSPVIGSLEYLQSGFSSNPGQLFDCPVLTVNGHGRWIRCWDEEGVLLSDHKLPDSFLAEVEKNSSDFKIHWERYLDEKSGDPMLQIVCVQFSSRSIKTHRYQFKSKDFSFQSEFQAGEWLSPSTSCSLITSKNLICADAKQIELHVLDVSQSNSAFQSISFHAFGLKSDSKPKHLTLHRLPYQDDDSTLTISTKSVFAKWKHFSVDLGGEGFVLLKIRSEPSTDSSSRVQLVKIFPRAVRLTFIPLTPNLEELRDAEDGFAVAALFQKPEALKEQETGNRTKIFAFKLAVFHVGSWTELNSLNADKVFLEFSTPNIPPINSGGKLVERLNDRLEINMFEIIPVRLSSMSKTGKINYRYIYKMAMVTQDDTLVLSNFGGKVSWSREEALADIVSAVFLDLPLSETDATLEQEYGFEGEEVYKSNIVTLFVNRIRSQLIQLKALANRTLQWISHLVGSARTMTRSQRKEQALEDDSVSDGDDTQLEEDEDGLELVRDYFGIHKLILLRTRVGKLFAMDSLTGNIIWSKYEPSIAISSDREAKFPIYVQRTSAHFPHSAVCTILAQSDHGQSGAVIYSLDPFTGATIDVKLLSSGVLQAMLVSSIHDGDYRRPIVYLDDQLKAHLYPNTANELFAKVADHYFMMIANQTSGLVNGLSFAKSTPAGPVVSEVWSFSLPREDTRSFSRLMTVFKRPNEHVHSQGRVLGDRNVLYKYVNPNLVAICWESLDLTDKPQISLFLVDSITGAIVYSTVHRRSRGPVHILHSENWIIYSYYNEKMRRNEFTSIELYEGYTQLNSTAFSSIGRDLRLMPLVEQQSFIFPTGLGPMVDTETQKGITNKHLLIFLPNGALLQLPRAFLDPRRPITPTPESQEEGVLPYVPELPVPSEMMINYNQTIFCIKNIITAPTSLESTSLVLAHGLDLYYTRVTPSKTFDILKDDFDHLLIGAVSVGLIVASYVAKWFASRKLLNQAWK